MRTLRLILGDQLNHAHPWFRTADPDTTCVMMEVRQETDYVRHHVQKVAAFFCAMRRFAAWLRKRGHRVVYLEIDDPSNHHTIQGNLQRLLRSEGASRVEYQFPDEYRLDQELAGLSDALDVPVEGADTGHFLTGRSDVADHFAGKNRYLMASFYQAMRRRQKVLLDEDGGPLGGQWSYDPENRKTWRGEPGLPEPLRHRNDVRGILRQMDRAGVDTFGEIDGAALSWPVDRRQALAQLRHFLKHGLAHFGTYQDAMTTASDTLFHSRLSFALNLKLLHPSEVVSRAVDTWEKSDGAVTLPQIEGFVRQVIGWREYVRGMYWAFMPGCESDNVFGFTRPLPEWYWTGETHMRCLSTAVTQSLQTAYAHHIQRLMITGNFALLAGVRPSEVERWYLGIYIDAIQWVELPNTLGMSQYADGGRLASKPYISSANYIRKMSDYCKGCAYDARKRTGEGACPFNSLYWNFLIENRRALADNPRMTVIYRQLDRMDPKERAALQKQAAQYLAHVDEL